ncbi:MAG: hypothetical protein AAF170_16585 [Bacteroidota bacterium]
MPDFQIPGVDGAEPTTVSLPDGYSLVGEGFDPPEGFVPAERFKSEVDRRLQSTIKNRGYLTPEEAYADDAIQAQLRERGYDLDADGKVLGKLDPDKIEAIRTEAVAPLREQLDAANGAIRELRQKALLADIQTTLTAELSDAAFTPAIPGTPSPVEALIASRVQTDDEGRPYVESDAGIPEYDVPKALLGIVQQNAKGLLRDKTQGGGGFGGGKPGSGGSGKVKTRSQFEALDPTARMEFMKAGGRVTD